MTGAAFLLSVVGMLYAWATDRPGLLILSFWAFLVAFMMLMARDNAKIEAVRQREALLRLHDEVVREALGGTPPVFTRAGVADWTALDEAWPTAARGSYPEEEEI